MKSERCKCGDMRQRGGGIAPPVCGWCETCQAGWADRTEQIPHRLVTKQIDTDHGKQPITRCFWCHRTKAQLEAAGEPIEVSA